MTPRYALIGLTGTNGSGKGEAADFFKIHGYGYHSLSDIIRDELRKKQRSITRNSLIEMGNTLRKKFGADILARRVMDQIKGHHAVIDSIRNPKEIAFLRKQEGFILLAIDAPVEIRYERVKHRGRNESASTLHEFIAKENEEMRQSDKGQQIDACLRLADYRVTNEGSLADFHKKLEKFL